MGDKKTLISARTYEYTRLYNYTYRRRATDYGDQSRSSMKLSAPSILDIKPRLIFLSSTRVCALYDEYYIIIENHPTIPIVWSCPSYRSYPPPMRSLGYNTFLFPKSYSNKSSPSIYVLDPLV